MSTKIEWTDETWNPVTGCTKVSAGCKHCYAERLFSRPYPGRAFTDVQVHPDRLDQPLRWRKPRRVFVNSMSDLFHEDVPDDFIFSVFAGMGMTYNVAGTDDDGVGNAYRPRHQYQVLTKRPGRMRDIVRALREALAGDTVALASHPFSEASRAISRAYGHPFWVNAWFTTWRWVDAGMPGLWLGVSVEDQATANERIPLLLETPATVRFVSYEPALGPVDLSGRLSASKSIHVSVSVEGALRNRAFEGFEEDGRPLSPSQAEVMLRELSRRGVAKVGGLGCDNFDPNHGCMGHAHPRIDWVIAGGESGPKARPSRPDWFRSVRDQCAAAGVPFFFKQWGDLKPSEIEGTQCDLDDPEHMAGAECAAWGDGETHHLHFHRVGKKAAGALLDGREHREYPEARP